MPVTPICSRQGRSRTTLLDQPRLTKLSVTKTHKGRKATYIEMRTRGSSHYMRTSPAASASASPKFFDLFNNSLASDAAPHSKLPKLTRYVTLLKILFDRYPLLIAHTLNSLGHQCIACAVGFAHYPPQSARAQANPVKSTRNTNRCNCFLPTHRHIYMAHLPSGVGGDQPRAIHILRIKVSGGIEN